MESVSDGWYNTRIVDTTDTDTYSIDTWFLASSILKLTWPFRQQEMIQQEPIVVFWHSAPNSIFLGKGYHITCKCHLVLSTSTKDTTVEHDSINTFFAGLYMLWLWVIITLKVWNKCQPSLITLKVSNKCQPSLITLKVSNKWHIALYPSKWAWGHEAMLCFGAFSKRRGYREEKTSLATSPLEARQDSSRQSVASKGIELSITFAWTR